MGITVFREVIPCIVLEVYRHTGEPTEAYFTLKWRQQVSPKRKYISNRLLTFQQSTPHFALLFVDTTDHNPEVPAL